MIITENNAIRDYGCLMAFPDKEIVQKLYEINKQLLTGSMIYTEENDDSYGIEKTPHCTIKYGFNPDLTNRDLGDVLKGIQPLSIRLNGISLFQNDKFDVVKFDVEPSAGLLDLRKKCDGYPNEDKYKNYKPHMTIGYVQKGTFTPPTHKINIPISINRVKYSSSGIGGNRKLFINFGKKTPPLQEMDIVDQGFNRAKKI